MKFYESPFAYIELDEITKESISLPLVSPIQCSINKDLVAARFWDLAKTLLLREDLYELIKDNIADHTSVDVVNVGRSKHSYVFIEFSHFFIEKLNTHQSNFQITSLNYKDGTFGQLISDRVTYNSVEDYLRSYSELRYNNYQNVEITKYSINSKLVHLFFYNSNLLLISSEMKELLAKLGHSPPWMSKFGEIEWLDNTPFTSISEKDVKELEVEIDTSYILSVSSVKSSISSLLNSISDIKPSQFIEKEFRSDDTMIRIEDFAKNIMVSINDCVIDLINIDFEKDLVEYNEIDSVGNALFVEIAFGRGLMVFHSLDIPLNKSKSELSYHLSNAGSKKKSTIAIDKINQVLSRTDFFDDIIESELASNNHYKNIGNVFYHSIILNILNSSTTIGYDIVCFETDLLYDDSFNNLIVVQR